MIDPSEITPIDLETTSRRPRRRLVIVAGVTTAVMALVVVAAAGASTGNSAKAGRARSHATSPLKASDSIPQTSTSTTAPTDVPDPAISAAPSPRSTTTTEAPAPETNGETQDPPGNYPADPAAPPATGGPFGFQENPSGHVPDYQGGAFLTGTVHIDTSKITLSPDAEIVVDLAPGVWGGSNGTVSSGASEVPYLVSTFAPGHYQGTVAVRSDDCPGETPTPNHLYSICTNLPSRTFEIDIAVGANTQDLQYP